MFLVLAKCILISRAVQGSPRVCDVISCNFVHATWHRCAVSIVKEVMPEPAVIHLKPDDYHLFASVKVILVIAVVFSTSFMILFCFGRNRKVGGEEKWLLCHKINWSTIYDYLYRRIWFIIYLPAYITILSCCLHDSDIIFLVKWQWCYLTTYMSMTYFFQLHDNYIIFPLTWQYYLFYLHNIFLLTW